MHEEGVSQEVDVQKRGRVMPIKNTDQRVDQKKWDEAEYWKRLEKRKKKEVKK